MESEKIIIQNIYEVNFCKNLTFSISKMRLYLEIVNLSPTQMPISKSIRMN